MRYFLFLDFDTTANYQIVRNEMGENCNDGILTNDLPFGVNGSLEPFGGFKRLQTFYPKAVEHGTINIRSERKHHAALLNLTCGKTNYISDSKTHIQLANELQEIRIVVVNFVQKEKNRERLKQSASHVPSRIIFAPMAAGYPTVRDIAEWPFVSP